MMKSNIIDKYPSLFTGFKLKAILIDHHFCPKSLKFSRRSLIITLWQKNSVDFILQFDLTIGMELLLCGVINKLYSSWVDNYFIIFSTTLSRNYIRLFLPQKPSNLRYVYFTCFTIFLYNRLSISNWHAL